ncbi:extracellular solute-binding protein [Amycolatopsis acidiphila]|uniref:ABC transporter substrate-binding protein n=1 Tax=Amycolatopsis acidiphila TaxID=715473 RepID=UPI001643E74E|nr:extracellular solute-binding protein [Amycolatopsis acidiphila]UIJ62483.1 extracellular solute-binding protein [Amycolatopsis acidiphila]
MRRYRNRLLAGLSAGLVGTLLAACSGFGAGSDDSGGQTITALVAAAGAGQKEQYDQYYQALAEEFHKETGATVNFQYYNGGAQENSIVQTSLVSGSGPDVIGYGSALGGTLYGTQGFLTLSQQDWDQVGGRDSWNPSTLSVSGPSPTEDIGVPSFSVPYMVAYNKAMFAKAGITGPPRTWNEWIEDAQKIQAASPGVYGAGFDPADTLDPWKFVWSYTHQLGGSLLSRDGKEAQLDSDQVKTAIGFYFSQLYQYHIVPPESLTWNNAQMLSAFTAGKVAMLPIATRSTLTAAQSSPVANDIAFAPLPSVPFGMAGRPAGGTPALSIVSGQFWAVFKYAENKKSLALALAKASNSDAVVLKQYQSLGWTPSTKAGIEMLAKAQPDAKPFLDVAASQEATEFTSAWAQLQAGLSTTINKVGSSLAVNGRWNDQELSSELAAGQQAAQAALK